MKDVNGKKAKKNFQYFGFIGFNLKQFDIRDSVSVFCDYLCTTFMQIKIY